MAVDGKSFGEEVGWVEDGAEVWEDKHALGDAIPAYGKEDPQIRKILPLLIQIW